MSAVIHSSSVLEPADRCVVCGGRIEDIGGRRLVATPHRGFALSDHEVSGGWENFRLCLRLYHEHEVYMVAWGEKDVFSDSAILRALADFQLGRRPWFCQRCGRRACPDCGALLWRPVASDYVFDDGQIVHCAILGADPGCWNPECARFRSSLGMRDVFWVRRPDKRAKT